MDWAEREQVIASSGGSWQARYRFQDFEPFFCSCGNEIGNDPFLEKCDECLERIKHETQSY